MGSIDKLVEGVPEPALRTALRREIERLKRDQRFGIIYEEHAETAALAGMPIDVGAQVERSDTTSGTIYEVKAISNRGRTAWIVDQSGNEESCDVLHLLVHKRLGEPIYAGLTPLGSLKHAPDKPYHAVINGENFHALQLFTYLLEGRVDCIYIDPPYNTGARDWKYSNRFVDSNDTWRHSKWLSMMEKRLKLARRLLKPDGVLICTVDEHEVHHLGMLLEGKETFGDYLRYMVTIVHNPKGTYKKNLARVNEYAFFCCPDGVQEVIEELPDGLFLQARSPEELETVLAEGHEDLYLRRRGQESGHRHQRPNQFYAILVDEESRVVLGVGPPLGPKDGYKVKQEGSVVTVYPIDTRGEERVWRYSRDTMLDLIEKGQIVVTGYSRNTPQRWVLNHRRPRKVMKRIKSVWWEKRHDAGGHGSDLLTEYLGKPGLFPFPKSIYAVRDCLSAVVRNRPDALILDFFAGSGTTLHSVCLLNLIDGGRRRCVLVTNNEVDEGTARRLNRDGHFPGDPEYEKHGVFENVARPRVESVITGRRPDGKLVRGEHVWQGRRPFSAGFEENAEFFRLDYLDPDEVEIGSQLEAVLPPLWLAAGGLGEREIPQRGADFTMPEGSTYGVLVRESRFRQFRDALEKRPEVTHVWLVTDSEEAFAEMAAALPSHLEVSMLYRDYLRSFHINTNRTL